MFFSTLLTLAALIPFYLLGCFPTGLLLAKLKGVDLANRGSGNIGATNVTRTMGRSMGIITLLVDVAKGCLSVWLAFVLSDSNNFAALAGAASVAGHCFSIPGRLKGGKGVATSLGVLLGLNALAGLLALGIFVAVCFASKVVSIGSLSAAASAPILFMLLGEPDQIAFSVSLLSAIIFLRHYQNILRIIQGNEPKIGSYSTNSKPSGA